MQSVITGKAYVLGDNIDTDQIIPAKYLKVTDKSGLGEGLFQAWRYNADRMVIDYVTHCYMPAAGGDTCRMPR